MAEWTPKLDGLPDETLRCPDYLEAAENHTTEEGEEVSVYEAQVGANGNEGFNGEDGFPLCCACGGERSEHRIPPPPNVPNPGSDAAIALGCSCPVLDNGHGKGVEGRGFTVNHGCEVHGEPAFRRDARPCPHCGNRLGDPAWHHVGALVFADETYEVTKCHRATERDERTGKPVPKFPDERELGEAFHG